jgi:hypothetical protein
VLLRLAMLALRLTSPAAVGLASDDGFVIGEATLSGSYNLLNLGGALGVIGAAAYVAVSPLLPGPRWLRLATVAAAAAIIGGAAAIHPDGVDFTLLEPPWLAVGLFLLVPLLTGVLVATTVDWVDRRPGSSTASAWLPPLALTAALPLTVLATIPTILLVAVLLPARRAWLGPVLTHPWSTWLARTAFASIPLIALAGLWPDLRQIL